MSNLLINEPPLQVLPTLATQIGLNEAIVLQQIHYWISNPKVGKEHDGRRWIYNSVREWQESNFPFWSENTIRRALSSLLDKGLILSANLNAKTYDRTLWYTIDYAALKELESTIYPKWANGSNQGGQMDSPKMGKPIPETTIDNTQTTQGTEPLINLAEYFCDITGRKMPYKYDSNHAINLWWEPLVEIHAQHGTVKETKAAMYRAVQAAKEAGLTITTPKSLINMAAIGINGQNGYRTPEGVMVVSGR